MCRYHQLWGGVLAAFGFGILVGAWLEGGFLCSCFALGLIVGGIWLVRKTIRS